MNEGDIKILLGRIKVERDHLIRACNFHLRCIADGGVTLEQIRDWMQSDLDFVEQLMKEDPS